MRLVLIGDGQSPHLLKWARALSPHVDLWAASTRGFAPEFSFLIPERQMLALETAPAHDGGNLAVVKQLPRLGAWLAEVNADWLHAHYLTSHGTLAWAAKTGWSLRAKIVGSAWGSDILVTPERSWAYGWLTRKVLSACTLCTSDSQHMTARMKALGAGEVMTFPFGLEEMPKLSPKKQPWLFFSNRGLEPLYRPQRVIEAFAVVAAQQPPARLVLANEGSLRAALVAQASRLGLSEQVEFVGRLHPLIQAGHYARSRWYFSLPESDSVAVSVLEAMAHQCVPILSDLPANHELISAERGVILREPNDLLAQMAAIDADAAGLANRAWVSEHGMFPPAALRFLRRLREL